MKTMDLSKITRVTVSDTETQGYRWDIVYNKQNDNMWKIQYYEFQSWSWGYDRKMCPNCGTVFNSEDYQEHEKECETYEIVTDDYIIDVINNCQNLTIE